MSERDIFDNMLIFGDNLPALKALEAEFAGRTSELKPGYSPRIDALSGSAAAPGR